MATQSIIENIVITEPKAAEIFVSALEEAAKTAQTPTPHRTIACENVEKKDIQRFLGAFIK